MQECALRTSERGLWWEKLSAKGFISLRPWRTPTRLCALAQIVRSMPIIASSHPKKSISYPRFGPSHGGASILWDPYQQLQATSSTQQPLWSTSQSESKTKLFTTSRPPHCKNSSGRTLYATSAYPNKSQWIMGNSLTAQYSESSVSIWAPSCVSRQYTTRSRTG